MKVWYSVEVNYDLNVETRRMMREHLKQHNIYDKRFETREQASSAMRRAGCTTYGYHVCETCDLI